MTVVRFPDDGRCHDCDGRPYRVICPYRGQHPPPPCPHNERRERTFGFMGSTRIVECPSCGEVLEWDDPLTRLRLALDEALTDLPDWTPPPSIDDVHPDPSYL